MRCAPRQVFAILSALSLLLCVATCALWVRSYRYSDGFRLPLVRAVVVFSTRGDLGVEWRHPDPRLALIKHLRPYSYHGFFVGFFGSERLDTSDFAYPVGTVTTWTCRLHDWFVASVLALLPAWDLARRAIRSRRAAEGLCRRCGYDLRATPDRCPECGMANPRAV